MRRERSFADDDVLHRPAEVDAARQLVERLERRERVLAAMPRPPGNWPEVSRGPIAHIPVTGRIHFFCSRFGLLSAKSAVDVQDVHSAFFLFLPRCPKPLRLPAPLWCFYVAPDPGIKKLWEIFLFLKIPHFFK